MGQSWLEHCCRDEMLVRACTQCDIAQGHALWCELFQSKTAAWRYFNDRPPRTERMESRSQHWVWVGSANPPHWEIRG